MNGARLRDDGTMSGRDLLRRLRWLIFYAWNVPPVFGLGFILLIGVMQADQIAGILTTPLEPAYIFGWLAFAVWFLPRGMRPLAEWLDRGATGDPEAALRAVRRFPVVFWITFLIYLAVAPVSVILAAEIYTGFVATPYDWFRIELVALIVSIIVGLPIFFLIFDLFGRALGAVRLAHPIVTIRTKVFLIGALVPLLIDTMLVQYYWTRTGYFTFETFGVWLLLEALAIGGSLIFAHSFGQSLRPLQALTGEYRLLPEASIDALRARSTDEIGVLTAGYRSLLEEQRLQAEILELNNQLLKSTTGEEGTRAVFHQAVELCRQALRVGQVFVLVRDDAADALVAVAQSGADYRPEGHFRLPLDEPSLAVWAFNQQQTVAVADTRSDPRVSPLMCDRFDVRSALAAPLRLDDAVIGVLMATTHDGPRTYSARDIALVEGLAREVAYALHAERLRESRAQAEAARQEQQERFGLLLNSTAEGIYGVDTEGICTFVNPTCLRMLGYSREEEMIGKPVHALIHHTYPDGRPYPMAECRVRMSTLDGLPSHADDEVHWRADGSSFAVEYWSHPIYRNGRLEGAVVTFVDITERKVAEERIRRLAYFDALTELPNRRLLMDRLGHAQIASSRTHQYGALMILDLDNFKDLNDTQGHDIGDLLLVDVAQRLLGFLRQEDTVARLGGDEYVVMVEHLGQDQTEAAKQAEVIAEKIRHALNQPYARFRNGHPYRNTSSIGLTLFRGQEVSIESLLKQADVALYQAKGAGRNAVRFFNPEMQAVIDARSEMETALRHGLEHGELRLFYQPQTNLAGQLVGAEALLRWIPAGGSLVEPAQFIPLAEETGLIVPLGQWVLQTACDQLKAWEGHPRARDLQLAVNVSARQFRQADFMNQIRSALDRSGANPALLKLELTESALLEDVEEAIVRMLEIKALGVTFALDDFGTGYSSLSYLKRLPLDQLKIDQSFVRDVDTNPNDAAIVRAILAMSQSLGIQAIAEGVESEAQLDFLKASGCTTYQGYLFGEPMPIEDWAGIL